MSLFDIKDPSKLQIPDVQLEDFKKALSLVKPSVSQKDLEEQIRFTKEFGEGEHHADAVFREKIAKEKLKKYQQQQRERQQQNISTTDDEEEEEDSNDRSLIPG